LKSEDNSVSGQTQKQVQMSLTGAINDYNGLFLPVLSINVCSVLVLSLPSVMPAEPCSCCLGSPTLEELMSW